MINLYYFCFRTFQRIYIRCTANVYFKYMRGLRQLTVSLLPNLQRRYTFSNAGRFPAYRVICRHDNKVFPNATIQ